METKITAHCLVKNEERFVWYSVMSVIDFIDEILLWDTGSTDKTKEIIKLISRENSKVKTNYLKSVTPEEFADVRQAMLDATDSDWFVLVDGDEVWWGDSMCHLLSTIKEEGHKLESIVVPTINLVGDMYHYQEEVAGLYRFGNKRGHYNLRAVNKNIPGLHSANPHGTWGWADEDGKQIQNRDSKKIKFIDAPYLHASFLQRAGALAGQKDVPKRAQKLKYEIGETFPLDFYYPEVFFRPKPDVVPNIWEPMSNEFKQKALWQTPLRKLKRRILPAKVGY
ncbi:hypothetical protein A2630_04635 [Candidatus Woesebacteria bacterium RIFCSPHIGHO2_01_FULL_44_10]|uniref:Glycosyltransferase 2-like domain-containing protein n=1 Tax=Candidatus Woesebacteria bacterium RIFCSPLOWO2_01_FULL_44_14 TaxID=1802525 RepID=A0A1F8C3A3_9BACT|nr:MAG: hypothetical protein A2630_04635 [Candidatus Woesebacteria bacterium RIFCSPHIGHO2_01_FULL_44_10]OGM56050.1 MAG: hypothetical protein A3F62_03980 [Candidatus Woesebacteria bacterium RIFCSPHIGHO2_12_FULL_44_11]OGM70773.1 MAG: hypothetical protein A2975_02690 [Candidatus Woesebacteria bacterium RIFCSPLOWO2_01_FULL_44_14]